MTDYWMPYLEKNSRLADCPPEEFNATDGWVPLYTPEKLEEHLPAALSAFGSAKPPRLTAVVPPNFPLGIDKEFMLTSFHVRGCLRRASLMVNGKLGFLVLVLPAPGPGPSSAGSGQMSRQNQS